MIAHFRGMSALVYGRFDRAEPHEEAGRIKMWMQDAMVYQFGHWTVQHGQSWMPKDSLVQMDDPEPAAPELVVYDGPPPQATWRALNTSTQEDLSA